MALRLDSTEIIGTSKLSYRYQVTLPKEVRKRFDLKENEQLIFVENGDSLELRKSEMVYL